ncbi:GNAT family N-acetyltransferase [Marinomonas sp.]|nr:GNAT family N-acetyltransferase [Marinomonas sp.]MDB4837327.1 GNAT family N-acetyltransferase [Marinomonas sp.]
MEISIDDLSGYEIKKLLTEHLQDMFATSSAESVHALDLTELKKPDIIFWTAWETDQLLGCGALKSLGDQHGEIKSMRTTEAARGKGVASHLLQHIIQYAKQQNLSTLSLETGTQDFFEPARRLYQKHGFIECSPFADYTLDPNSIYMTKFLTT